MARFPLLGGAYAARSSIANAQRCVNLYPELNRKDAPFPFTLYQRPGLLPKVSPGVAARGRGLYRASNGAAYAAIGDKIYYVNPAFGLVLLGSITALTNTPVSFTDNGQYIVIFDGSPNQWSIEMLTNTFAPLVDASGNMTGATRGDTVDTFIIWNRPDTRQFGSTLSNLLTTNGLSFAAKATYPDKLKTLIVRRTEIVLLGDLKGEIWYNVGGPIFPFARLPGSYVEYGIAAPYSVAANDISVFWLSKSLEGQGMILKLRGYEVTRISNHALEFAISQMSDISDAVGYCYQQGGHLFYVIHFPTGDQTWVWDESIGDPMLGWHQEAWTDSNGILHRHRGNAFALVNGLPCTIDWETGTIYHMDLNTFTDTVSATVYDISFIRTFPQVTQVENERGELIDLEEKSATFDKFVAYLECGNVNAAIANGGIGLIWSQDGGRTYGQTVLQSAGLVGEYRTQPAWAGLGLGKNTVFELRHSIPGAAALNGAFLHGRVNEQ